MQQAGQPSPGGVTRPDPASAERQTGGTGSDGTRVGLAVAAGFQPLRHRTKPVVDRLLPARQVLTLLFTDIVGSTQHAVELGDQRWREALETYRAAVRRELKRFGGHEAGTAGDSFFATFHAPVPSLRCGQAIAKIGRDLGLKTRVGIHCDECEMRGEGISGVNPASGASMRSREPESGLEYLQGEGTDEGREGNRD